MNKLELLTGAELYSSVANRARPSLYMKQVNWGSTCVTRT
jgi:hypothetical protein